MDHLGPSAPALGLADVVASVSFTACENVTGLPAISLPLHWTEAGLPVGAQLVGGPWDEATLIRLSAQLEEAMPWAGRRPSLSEVA
jgi:amidase